MVRFLQPFPFIHIFAMLISAIASETNSDSSGDLKIEKVDTRFQENAIAHHTERFDQVEHGGLIVRRGQEFRIVITFNRPFTASSDIIKISFMIGTYYFVTSLISVMSTMNPFRTRQWYMYRAISGIKIQMKDCDVKHTRTYARIHAHTRACTHTASCHC